MQEARNAQAGGTPDDHGERLAALQQEIDAFRRERDLISAGLIIHAADGTLLFSNAAASRMLGLTPEQLAGRTKTDPYWRFLRADGSTMPPHEYPVAVVARTLAPLSSYLVGVVRGEGQSAVWVQCDAYPELDAAGQLQRIVVSAVDVTALRESTSRLHLALQAASLGDWDWDLHSDRVQLSPRAADILGFGDQPVTTWGAIRERLHPQDAERAAAAVLEAVARRSTYEVEYRIRCGAEERWIAAWGRGTYGARDQAVGMIGVVQDITQRKREQQNAAAETELLELLNETASLLGAELDLDKLLQGVTDAATKLTGAQFGAFFYNGRDEEGEAYLLYTLAGAPRSAFERFGHPRPTPLFAPTFHGAPVIRLDDVLADPRYGQWGPHHGMPPGHLPVRSYLAVAVMSRRGDVIGGLFFGHPQPGVFTERSERLALGIAAQASTAIDNAQLYAEATRATRQRDALLESERAARSEAESASRLKDQFLATLSHELRTPLSAVLGWLHILRRKGVEDPQTLRKGLDVIERSARTQHRLVEDLLDMSRITSGKLALATADVRASEFIRAALDLVEPTAAAAGIAIHVHDASAGAVVHGDSARLQQVVWNLLSNAVKFTPPGGHVRLHAFRQGDALRIRVEDTGIGIRSEFLPHLFERFRQADGSTARHHGGLGLGLALVHQFVQLHGGSVHAESEGEGRGSRFTVALPLATQPQPAEGQAPDSEPAAPLAGRVLVVEDDAAGCEFLERILRDAGLAVSSAHTVAQARQALGDGAGFDLLISDIGLPGEDGYELVRWLRKRPDALAGIPAMALTAFVRPQDVQAAGEAGFDAHVAKPVNPAILLREVARLLNPAWTRGAGGDAASAIPDVV